MPTIATVMEATISPYPRRRLNQGPKVASAKDTMPRARNPAFVDRNAVAFNIGPSEWRGRVLFPPPSGPCRPPHAPPRPPPKGEGRGEPRPRHPGPPPEPGGERHHPPP